MNVIFTNLFSKNGLVGTSVIYTLSSIIEKAIPFLLLPILTRYLMPEDYGIISMFTVLVGITLPFISLNTGSAILRTYYKKDIKFSLYISNSLFLILVNTTIVAFFFLVFSDFIVKISGLHKDWIYYVILVSFSQFIINILLVIWQAQAKALRYGTLKILLSFLNLGISVILIVKYDFSWEGRIIGQVAAISFFSLISLFLLLKGDFLKFKLVSEYIKHAIRYGAPLIPHVVSGMVITMSDRIFITNMIGLSETGIYTVGYQIGMIIEVISHSFQIAWTPWLYKQLNKNIISINKKIVSFSYIYMVSIILMAILLALLAPYIMHYLIGEKFRKASEVIFWIALAYSFKGMYYILVGYITFKEKTQILTWITLTIATVNLILNYFFINSFGVLGAAYSTTFSYFLQFILIWVFASKNFKMPWFKFLTTN